MSNERTTQVWAPGDMARDLLIFQMALREAKRRSKKRNPSARWLMEVLDDLGLKVSVI